MRTKSVVWLIVIGLGAVALLNIMTNLRAPEDRSRTRRTGQPRSETGSTQADLSEPQALLAKAYDLTKDNRYASALTLLKQLQQKYPDFQPDKVSAAVAEFTSAKAKRDKEREEERAKRDVKENNATLTYEVLKGPWHPYEAATGLGLEILIPESATQEGIIQLLRQLSAARDPVSIRVWTSRIAYENEMRNLYGSSYDDLYARHLICMYTKNLTVRRAFFGSNEIKWIQEKGKFAHLQGQTTPMQ